MRNTSRRRSHPTADLPDLLGNVCPRLEMLIGNGKTELEII